MIRFFRNIRKNLLGKGKFSRYLLYALGEIFLVMIGILLALQVNTWNQLRTDRQKEQVILKQLKAEFESNLNQLEGKNMVKMELIHAVIRLFEFIDRPDLRQKDSIHVYLGRTIPYSSFDPIVNDLAVSGDLKFITNDSLKLMLSLWVSDVNDVKEDESNWKFYRNEIYVPFLIEHYQLRTIRNVALQADLWKNYLIESGKDINDQLNVGIGNTNFTVDFNTLLDNPDFEDHLERAISQNRFAFGQSIILKGRILEILRIVDSEIE